MCHWWDPGPVRWFLAFRSPHVYGFKGGEPREVDFKISDKHWQIIWWYTPKTWIFSPLDSVWKPIISYVFRFPPKLWYFVNFSSTYRSFLKNPRSIQKAAWLTTLLVSKQLMSVRCHGHHIREAVSVDDGNSRIIMIGILVTSLTVLPVIIQTHIAIAQVTQGSGNTIHLSLSWDHPIHDVLHHGLVHIRSIQIPRSPSHRWCSSQAIVNGMDRGNRNAKKQQLQCHLEEGDTSDRNESLKRQLYGKKLQSWRRKKKNKMASSQCDTMITMITWCLSL